jgi:hypothetical protein
VSHYRSCGVEGNPNENRYQWNLTEASYERTCFDERKRIKGEIKTTAISFGWITGGGRSPHLRGRTSVAGKCFGLCIGPAGAERT